MTRSDRPPSIIGIGTRLVAALAVVAASLLAVTIARPPAAQAAINGLAQRPYLGWSSWSLESTDYPGVNPDGSASWLTEKHVLQQADVMAAKLKKYGYDYINIDAGWQGGVDAYGRPVPNRSRFPDGIRYVADKVHALGLKLGIYTVVGLGTDAYNDGKTPIYGAPGCHTSDIVYPDLRKTNGWDAAYKIDYASPCAQAYANSIADVFASWGVDFVKMDGVGPGSFKGGPNYDNTDDIAAWSRALKQTGRPIQYMISWALSHNEASTWRTYTNGWRIDTDVECYCNTLVRWDASVKQRWNDVIQWIPDAKPGGWNNLDSLDVGNGAMDGLTHAERRSYMTLWAIEAAPLYIGDDLTTLDSYGLKLLQNRAVIGIDQAGRPARPVSQRSNQQVWYARNPDGSYTVALFNLDPQKATVTANWRDLGFTGQALVRDVWTHRIVGSPRGRFGATLPAHGSRLLHVIPTGPAMNLPSAPTGLRATAATPSSVSLAWHDSASRTSAVTGYEVEMDGRKVADVGSSSATVTGLQPASDHRFTVIARDGHGRRSPAATALSLTTPAAHGPVTYEAEAPANTVGGSAAIYSCTGCSGGKKVGYLGGSGYLTFNDVVAPRAGTYLMRISYVDGDSSRPAIVTADGTSFDVNFQGTNDNDWGTAQTTTVPIHLHAGANTIRFADPDAYVADIDKITL